MREGELKGLDSAALTERLKGKAGDRWALATGLLTGAAALAGVIAFTALIGMHRAALERHEGELEQRVTDRTRELQEALANVKQLQGLLPICAWCKKVRDDGDYWHEVEHYIAAHTEARFTHGICPKCLDRNLKALEATAEGDRTG